ncbi:EAL domain-containing protein [Uliginosibacterium sp. H3]|uniref:EAL domain-containing protein n=1 Tax=Uliginosibacterium silvisoli TaxID=3114758 RepID=A0ABU6K1K1_9RHOO|nr:EAL domain-containing protein [Uliginosibacterium sp. H3]
MIFPSVEHLENLSNGLQSAFIRLSRDEALWLSDLNGALRHLTASVAQAIDVARVGVWLSQDDEPAIACVQQLLVHEGRFERGSRLQAKDYPGYFRALASGRVIDAADAVNDYRTAEFAASYLLPKGIGAVLDATLHNAGRLCGVLCIEHVGSARLWSRDEQNFATSVADLVSQLLMFHSLKDSERQYRTLFNAAGDAILTLKGGRIIDCNPRALTLFGCTREGLLGSMRGDLSPPIQPNGQMSAARLMAILKEIEDGTPTFFEWVFRRPSGVEWEAEISAASIVTGSDHVVLAIIRDVTERRQAERVRHQSALLLARRNGALQVVNRLAGRLHGMTDVGQIAQETVRVLRMLQDVPCITFLRVMPDGKTMQRIAVDGDGIAELMGEDAYGIPIKGSLAGRAIQERRILISGDVEHDERVIPSAKVGLLKCGMKSLVVLPLVFSDEALGSIGLLFHEANVMFGDIEMETLNTICQTVSLAMVNARHVQVLEHQALHDSLTLLPNRAHLHREATRAIRQASERAQSVSLMLLDLDRFKEVNDTLGHHAGDLLIKLVGERLREALVRRDAMLARLGGDEFAVLLRVADSLQDAQSVALEMVAALRRPFDVQGIAIELGGSIGVAIYPQHGDSSNALLRCADVAMYAAKSAVGNVSTYSPEHDQHNPRRLAMITELGSAIGGNQLVLHFQPKLDLATGEWSGSEALVRWVHPQLGQIPPGEFIQFAETSDLIRPLTLWVARRALEQMREWHQRGLDLPVSINLSTRNLLDVTFPDSMAALLKEYGVPPHLLELEITETALIGDPNRAMSVVERLVDQGMRLSIDDFGTGYSSLAYLKRLPLHALKIDRSFVRDMLTDEQDAIIVRSTIGLAHSLGLQVVAEGVEDVDTLAVLREFGCDLAQGYVLSKPVAADQAERRLTAPYLAAND